MGLIFPLTKQHKMFGPGRKLQPGTVLSGVKRCLLGRFLRDIAFGAFLAGVEGYKIRLRRLVSALKSL